MAGLLTTLFSPTGRVRRRTYWLALLGLPIAGIAVLVLLAVIARLAGLSGGPLPEHAAAAMHPANPALRAFSGLSLIAVVGIYLWAKICLHIKRWHDRDRPWPYIFVVFIPFVGVIWALIECGFMDGTPGPNQFGPSPKGITRAPDAF